MLEIRDLSVFYGDAQAIDGVSLSVDDGQVVALVGANGAGKTSLIRTVAGILKPRAGSIRFDGREIGGQDSHRVCNLGVGQVAEGRQVFPSLSVLENLQVRCCRAPGRTPRRRSTGSSRCSPDSRSARRSRPARCRAASSRCSRSAAA